jgi:hypothetical protein
VPIQIANYGEAAYWALGPSGIELNGEPLRSADILCTHPTTHGISKYCDAFVIGLGDPLLAAGATYDVTIAGRGVGSFTAELRAVGPTPQVVAVTATAHTITVRFNKPMSSAAECGREWASSGRTGTLQWLRGTDEPTLFSVGHGGYRGGDDQLDWSLLLASWSETNADCTAVTFRSAFGFPPGDHDFLVTAIRDANGVEVLPESWLTLSVPSEGVPELLAASIALNTHELQHIRLIFSTPLDPSSVADTSAYRLNGQPLPTGTEISCEVPTCSWVELDVPSATFEYGGQNVIEVEGLVDLAGVAMPARVSTPFTSWPY